jgi:hypothetical protein
VVVTDYRIAEKTNEKGQCSVSIDCKRAGVSSTERTEADFPRATTTSAVKALQEAVIGDIKIRLKDTLDTNTLVQGFAKVRSTLLTVLGRVQAAQTLLNTITSTINDLSNLIAQGIRAPDEFAGAFFRAIASIFGGLLEIKNSFDIYSVSRSGSIYPDPNNTENSMSSYPYPADTNEKNMLLQFLGASTYTLNMQAATAPKRATQEAIEQCYRIGALCVASQIIVQMEGISYQTAQGYWNLLQKLEASIDKDNPVVYAAIEELRISVSGELAVKELSAEIHRTFTSPLPLLAMAQYVGCNADKLRELNRVADSFVLTGEVVYV